MLETGELSLNLHWDERNKELGTRIMDRVQLLADRDHVDREFFRELTLNSLCVGFTVLALAAWKLPEAAVPLVGWALTDKHSIIGADHCRDNANGRGVHTDNDATAERSWPQVALSGHLKSGH